MSNAVTHTAELTSEITLTLNEVHKGGTETALSAILTKGGKIIAEGDGAIRYKLSPGPRSIFDKLHRESLAALVEATPELAAALKAENRDDEFFRAIKIQEGY